MSGSNMVQRRRYSATLQSRSTAPAPTVRRAIAAPSRLASPDESGLAFVLPAAFLAAADELLADALADEFDDALPVAAEEGAEVMLPCGTFVGEPGVTPAAPMVGSAALGSTVHALAPAV